MAMVLYDVSDGIATLTLNNPQERNSMTADMVSEIVAAMDAAGNDHHTNVWIALGGIQTFVLSSLPARHLRSVRAPTWGTWLKPHANRCSASTKDSCVWHAALCRRLPR